LKIVPFVRRSFKQGKENEKIREFGNLKIVTWLFEASQRQTLQ